MRWRWIAVLGALSSAWVSGAQGQQQGQAGAPAATGSTESEISTRVMDTPIKVQVNLVLVRVVVRDAGGKNRGNRYRERHRRRSGSWRKECVRDATAFCRARI